jgi:hypothetical protein
MASMDIFNQDAFSQISLTQAFENTEYLPQELNGLFTPKPISTSTAMIEIKDNEITLIPTTLRGEALEEMKGGNRSIRSLNTVRMAKGSTINAVEVANIRSFGSETEAMQIQDLITERIQGLNDDLELSFEYMRLGALQGLVLNPKDGSVIYNMYSELGVTQDAEVDFDLDSASPAEGALVKKCNAMVRKIIKNSKGAVTPTTRIVAKVGENFWDDLTAHPEVRETYKNWQQAEALRGDLQKPYSEFKFGGIFWKEYRGTDDGSKVAVGADKAIFYPENVKDNFIHTMSPADEFIDFVNTRGKRVYTMLEKDPSVNKKWVRPEIYAYPLIYCARPKTLQRGKRT